MNKSLPLGFFPITYTIWHVQTSTHQSRIKCTYHEDAINIKINNFKLSNKLTFNMDEVISKVNKLTKRIRN